MEQGRRGRQAWWWCWGQWYPDDGDDDASLRWQPGPAAAAAAAATGRGISGGGHPAGSGGCRQGRCVAFPRYGRSGWNIALRWIWLGCRVLRPGSAAAASPAAAGCRRSCCCHCGNIATSSTCCHRHLQTWYGHDASWQRQHQRQRPPSRGGSHPCQGPAREEAPGPPRYQDGEGNEHDPPRHPGEGEACLRTNDEGESTVESWLSGRRFRCRCPQDACRCWWWTWHAQFYHVW
mmetsp:Transcript_15197/g.30704  ORF Transcript_15197/g.30704 Transcript_15197/m.30704 type:complete len:234 (-) Transcript_15197:1199-1900(-)